MFIHAAAVLLLLRNSLAEHHQDESSTPAAAPGSSHPSAASALGALYRQARSEHFYPTRYDDDGGPLSRESSPRFESSPIEHRDSAYYESRCLTCEPSPGSGKPGAYAPGSLANKDPYASPGAGGRWQRQRGKYDYYEDELEDRRYNRDRYDPYYGYERARLPPAAAAFAPYDYDRYDPYYARNDLFRPSYTDRYDTYDRDRYYPRPLLDYPSQERPALERPAPVPLDRPERPAYERVYERGNGYDNLDPRLPYNEDRFDRYPGPRRPAYDDRYAPLPARAPFHDRGRYDPRYDYYERPQPSSWRRPYDDRYERPAFRYPAGPDSRGYYTSGAWGPGYERGYASAWNNYSGNHPNSINNRDNWRDVNLRDRDREQPIPGGPHNRDHDSGYYMQRDYFYDSTAAPGGARATSYYDRPLESSTKSEQPEREKPTSSPQTLHQDNKAYKD